MDSRIVHWIVSNTDGGFDDDGILFNLVDFKMYVPTKLVSKAIAQLMHQIICARMSILRTRWGGLKKKGIYCTTALPMPPES